MRRGTTPTHTFHLPFNTDIIDKVNITYSQCDKIVLEKNIEDCKLVESSIAVELSRAETLSFDDNEFVKIQLSVIDKNGKSLVSNVLRCEIGEVLNEREF
jgi:hypothetical protein